MLVEVFIYLFIYLSISIYLPMAGMHNFMQNYMYVVVYASFSFTRLCCFGGHIALLLLLLLHNMYIGWGLHSKPRAQDCRDWIQRNAQQL